MNKFVSSNIYYSDHVAAPFSYVMHRKPVPINIRRVHPTIDHLNPVKEREQTRK